MITSVSDGVRISLKITPGSSQNALGGPIDTGSGSALKVTVTAPPVDGAANGAIIKFLAKLWGIPKSKMNIISGHHSRNKILHIEGDPIDILAKLHF